MTYREAVRAFKRAYWEDLLLRCDQSVSAAAKLAGKNRSDAYKELAKLQVPYPSRRHMGNWGDLTH